MAGNKNIFTGSTHVLFIEWLMNHPKILSDGDGSIWISVKLHFIDNFLQLSPAMQWGVIQDFAIDNGIYIYITERANRLSFKIHDQRATVYYHKKHWSREEIDLVRIAAVEELNNLINKRYGKN